MDDRSEPIERRNRQILVVEDDGAVREMLVRVLHEDGYSAWPAIDGEEAVKIADMMRLDLVVLDLGLPGQGGWETFAQLTRRNPRLAVIVITAKPDQLHVAQAAGVALFEKPLDFSALLRSVEQLIAERPEARRARLRGAPKGNL